MGRYGIKTFQPENVSGLFSKTKDPLMVE